MLLSAIQDSSTSKALRLASSLIHRLLRYYTRKFPVRIPDESEYKDTFSRFLYILNILRTKDILLSCQIKFTVYLIPATSIANYVIFKFSSLLGQQLSIFDFQVPIYITVDMCDGKARKLIQEVVTLMIPVKVEVKNSSLEDCRSRSTRPKAMQKMQKRFVSSFLITSSSEVTHISEYYSKQYQSKYGIYHKEIRELWRVLG